MTTHVILPCTIYQDENGIYEWLEQFPDSVRILILGCKRVARLGDAYENILEALQHFQTKIELISAEHPTEDQARQVHTVLSEGSYSHVLAVGGGSIIDLSKAALYLMYYTDFDEQKPHQRAENDSKPKLVAVPTTLSGAEVNPGFGIVDSYRNKKVIWDERLAPQDVLYRPNAFEGAPIELIQASGINAIAHCLEGFYTKARDTWCDALAYDALYLLIEWLPRLGSDDFTVSGTLGLQRASAEAGWVAYQSKPALHHAICHVLGSRLGVGHAIANVIMLPYVLDTVPKEAWGESLNRIISILQIANSGSGSGISKLVREFIEVLFGKPPRLGDYISDIRILPEIAKLISGLPLVNNHPIPLSPIDVEDILRNAL